MFSGVTDRKGDMFLALLPSGTVPELVEVEGVEPSTS